MANFKQFADGSVGIFSEQEGFQVTQAGGPKTPTASTPNYRPGGVLKLSANGGTDTGGGITSWLNAFPFDIIVLSAVLDVTTVATGACTVSVGSTATNGTTSASNFISGQDVNGATGTFNSGQKSIKVLQGSWITASKATGGSVGMVANLYVEYFPA